MQTLIVLALLALVFRLTMAPEKILYIVNCFFFRVYDLFAIEILASY